MSSSRYTPLDTEDGDSLPLPVTASSSSAAASQSTSARLQSALERLASSKSNATKGKGRATVDPVVEEEPTGPTGMSFSVRFTEGEEDLVDIWVGEKATVREVKRRIRFLRPSLTVDGRPRRLRLIQLGRLLTDGTFLVPYTVQLLSRRAKLVKQQSQGNGEALLQGAMEGLEAVGVTVTTEKEVGDVKGKGKGKAKDSKGDWQELQDAGVEEDKRVWLHCSVGDVMEDDEIEGEKIQTSQITPLQGFDRLRDAGFSEEDIASMREEFRIAASASTPAGGDEDEHARALEDQWMEGLTGQNEAAVESSSTGAYTTLLQGVCIGFLVPFLPIFFFRTSIFSKGMQMGIILGIGINLFFGLLRAFS